MRLPFILSSLLTVFSFFNLSHATEMSAKELKPKKEQPTPWFTGPLLTPSGHAIPKGHWNIEPYEFVQTIYGVYDKDWHTQDVPHNFYSVQTQLPIQYGLGARFDFTFTPSWAWQHTHSASHWVLNDMNYGFDYQILYDKLGTWWPAIKLALRGNLPFGKYQHLSAKKKRTDIGGFGSWTPAVGITMSELFWWGGHIFFAARMNWQYLFPTPVHVRGLNTYGGGHGCAGKAFPGQALVGQFGFELSLSQRWALAGDVQYLHVNKTRFKGTPGTMADGTLNPVGGPSTDQWSVAPAIEYNWSPFVGIIAGVWFSVGARNSPEFATGVVAVNIYK
jgi:hypothetical protein